MEKLQMPYHCPRWAELPGIPLYLDQLVMVIDESIGQFWPEGEPPLTKTMINNYVKQKTVKQPEGKKYSRAHIARLIQVSLLKRVFSMTELRLLLDDVQEERGEEAAYDLFCARFENLLEGAFNQAGFSAKVEKPKPGQNSVALLDMALLALVGKLRVQRELEAALAAESPPVKTKEKAPKDKQAKAKPKAEKASA